MLINYSRDEEEIEFPAGWVDQVIIIESENEAWMLVRNPFKNELFKHIVPLDFYRENIEEILEKELLLDNEELDEFFADL